MKIFVPLSILALASLAIPFFASAQISPSWIFREQPTPTPQQSPAETPALATAPSIKTPPPRKSEKKAEIARSEPTTSKPRTPHAARHDKRPSGTAAETVAKLRQMEEEWLASPHNTAARYRTGEITFSQRVVTKTNKETADSSPVTGHMDVRLHGDKVAIVVGTAQQITKDKAGKKSATRYRFTDTWIERDGNWQCIASHTTALPRPAIAKHRSL